VIWSQVYDPLDNMWLLTLFASLPVIVMLDGLGIFHIKAHWASLLGLVVALVVAVLVFGMPAPMAGKTADIEQMPAYGVHGPKDLLVLVLTDR